MGKRMKKAVFGLFAITAGIHGVNQLIFKNAVKKDLLNKCNGKYFKTKYGKMYYEVKGNGKPILLLHDISCASSGYEWSNVAKKLSDKYKVYVVDLPGCGRSDKPDITYTSYLYVQILKDFAKNVIKEKFNIAATGKSASIAAMMSGIYKDLVEKIVAVSPEYIDESKYEKKEIADDLKKKFFNSPIYGTVLYNLAVSKNLIEEKFEEEYFFDSKNIKNNLINIYYESAHLGGGNARYLYSSLYYNYLYCNPLSTISKINPGNYMVVLGKNSDLMEKVESQYMDCNGNIEECIIEDAKFLPQLEKPDIVAEIIEKFLK